MLSPFEDVDFGSAAADTTGPGVPHAAEKEAGCRSRNGWE